MNYESPAMKSIQKVLVIDHAGNGFNVLWTLDGQTWVPHRKRPFNASDRDKALAYLTQFYTPETQVRNIEDFYGRIPEDWLTEGARVV
jgi:hypothetical protein